MQKSTRQIRIIPNYTYGDYLHEKYPELKKFPKEIIEEPFLRMIGERVGPSYKYLLVKTANEIERNIFSEYTDNRLDNLCNMFKRVKKEDSQIIYDSIDCLIRSVENKIKIPQIAEKGLYALARIAYESNDEIKKMVQEYISSVLKESAPGIRGMMIRRLESVETIDDRDIVTIASINLIRLDAQEYITIQKQAKSQYVKILMAMQKENDEDEIRNKRAQDIGPISFSQLMGIKPESITEAIILISKLNNEQLAKWNELKKGDCRLKEHEAQIDYISPPPNVILSETFVGELRQHRCRITDEFQAQIEEEIPFTDSMITGMNEPGSGDEEIEAIDSGILEIVSDNFQRAGTIDSLPTRRQQKRIIEPIETVEISEITIEPADPPEPDTAPKPTSDQLDDMELRTQLDDVISINDSDITAKTDPGTKETENEEDIEFLNSGVVEVEEDEELVSTVSRVEEISDGVHILAKPKPKTDLSMPLVEDDPEEQIEEYISEVHESNIEEASAPHDLATVTDIKSDRPTDSMLLRMISEPIDEQNRLVVPENNSSLDIIRIRAPLENLQLDREETNVFKIENNGISDMKKAKTANGVPHSTLKAIDIDKSMESEVESLIPEGVMRWGLIKGREYPNGLKPLGQIEIMGRQFLVFDTPIIGSVSLYTKRQYVHEPKIEEISQIGSINSEDSIMELLVGKRLREKKDE